MSNFYEKLNNTQNSQSVTENGAIGYKTTQSALVDFLFKLSSYRNSKSERKQDWAKVLKESDPLLIKFLFYIRDVRQGLGERDTFRECMLDLIGNLKCSDKELEKIIKLIPEYGRWDDLFHLNFSTVEILFKVIKQQLTKDIKAMKEGKEISLLAKWMPSINCSNKQRKAVAQDLCNRLGWTQKKYRKTLVSLRDYLDVVEKKMCAKEWGDIDYNTVPSKANVKYSNAFLKNDETRRREYLAKLAVGDKTVKINSTVNFPHDVLHMYTQYDSWNFNCKPSYDEAIEQLWKNLKQLDGLKDTMVVRDDSGSMSNKVGGSSVSAYEVATALGIYCAQHNSKEYKDKIISFSEHPKYLDFSDKRNFGSLHSIYRFLNKHSEVANTNIKAVFELILNTAISNNLDAKDLPKQILIISDMEFDSCAENVPLFKNIEAQFARYGYELPKLVFWNVCGRTGTIPVTQNKKGVILVSGFSQNILEMINSGETDPYKALVKVLKTKRYSNVPLFKK